MVQSISPVSRGKGRLSSSASLRLCPRAEASRMRLASKILASVLVLALSACDMKLTRTKTPSPPQPTEAKAEPPPSDPAANEPLSIPQTQVRLPRPQPIDPEALAMPPVSAPSEASAPRQSHRAKKGPAPSPPEQCLLNLSNLLWRQRKLRHRQRSPRARASNLCCQPN